jgi:hypothetical protein
MTVDAQLASGHVPHLYLVEMAFTTGTARVTNWGHTIAWGGHDWQAAGAFGIGAFADSERLEYPSLEIGLNVANPALLALARGQVHTYRRRPITVRRVVLDDENRWLDEPEVVWAGVMDQVRTNTGDGERAPASVVLRCEIPGRDGRAAQSLRLNYAQHQARYPGDTGLSRVEALRGKPQTWLSKKFQQVD